MLILTRKSGEIIQIGEDIKVQVIRIKGKEARLGIAAPPGYRIHREEVYQRILQEKEGNISPPPRRGRAGVGVKEGTGVRGKQ